jgi:hypothetical protein
MSAKGRNYKREYAKYHSKPLQKKRRAARNKGNRAMKKLGLIKKGDGNDVDHKRRNKNGNLSSARSNLRIVPKSKNRSRNQ